MSVRFDVQSLVITSFRGIDSFEMTFEPGTPTFLLGANNSGKSTVLNALALAFKGGGFDTFTPNEFDFHRAAKSHPSDTFMVQVSFKAKDATQLPAVQGMGNPKPVHGIRVLGERKDGGLVHRHQLIDEHSKSIVYSPRTPLTEKQKPIYSGQKLGYRNTYAKLDEIRDYLPEVWYLSPTNLQKSLYEWRAGPLQRLATMLTKSFIKEQWSFTYDGQRNPMPDTMKQLHQFFSEATRNFPFWKDELRPKLEETLSRYVGDAASIELRPGIQEFEEWLTQQIAMSFSAGSKDAVTPLRTLGDGWQALVRLAALETLVLVDVQREHPVLLLFEEPETYLHPHLKRKLRSALEQLAAKDWIVVVTTHSPEFLSFTTPQQVVRLVRTDAKTHCGCVLTKDLPDATKLQEKLDEYQSHEFLFSQRVILTEGKDDSYALNLYFRKTHLDCDARAISIVALRGVNNIPAYAHIAGQLRIPWCAVTDEDKYPDGQTKQNTANAREALTGIKTVSDMMTMWPESLEACLRVPDGKKALPEWQERHIAGKPLADLMREYPEYVATCDAIAKWARG